MPDELNPPNNRRNCKIDSSLKGNELHCISNCSHSALQDSGTNQEIHDLNLVRAQKESDSVKIITETHSSSSVDLPDDGKPMACTRSNVDAGIVPVVSVGDDAPMYAIVNDSTITPATTDSMLQSNCLAALPVLNGGGMTKHHSDFVDDACENSVMAINDLQIPVTDGVQPLAANESFDIQNNEVDKVVSDEQLHVTSFRPDGQKEQSNIDVEMEGSATYSFDILSRCSRAVVLKILGYFSLKELLHSVSLVCKNWNAMATDPDLWRKLDMRPYVVNDDILSTLPTLCNFITYIMLPDDRNEKLSDAGLISLARGCPNLRTFYAPRSGTQFTDEAFIAFAEHCKELRELHLDGLEITDRTLQSIALNLDKLEVLSLIQAGKFTDEGVAEVIKYCRNLRECILNQNTQITDDCFRTLHQSSKSLQRLEVMMCNIKSSGVPQVGVLHNLVFLNLTRCTSLTLEDLKPVLEGCKNMTSLSLNLDKKIDDACIDAIFFHRPNMRSIFLVSTLITDKALEIMAEKGKSLVRIDIGYTKVTAAGARIVSEKCPKLNYLGLMRCSLIRESSVEKMVKEFPHIWYSTFIQDTKKLLKNSEDSDEVEEDDQPTT